MTNDLAEVEKVDDGKTNTPNGPLRSDMSRISVDRGVNGEVEGSEPAKEQGLSEKEKDVPPNGGYGWVCVACVATING